MSWITKIQVENYRAFSEPEDIDIPTGNHLLIYGENGSGKSSIFKAIRDFFSSSNQTVSFTNNCFLLDAGVNNGNVTITIDGTPPSLVFDSNTALSTNNIASIIQAAKIKGFLDYKNILKAHAIDVEPGNNPNFFNFLIRNILAEHSIPNPVGGVGQVRLLEEYNRIKQILLSRYSHSHAYQDADVQLTALNQSLFNKKTPKGLLNRIFIIANWYLRKYFQSKVKVNPLFTPIEVYKEHDFAKKEMFEEINFEVYFGNKLVADYPAFLNEARLSALAMSIFLASLKVYPITQNELKVIFLDDVFIGLDNSNRIPLLEILRKEFILNGWQVIISTYDRQWFDLSLNWLKSNSIPCKQVQMFNESSPNPNDPDKPVIIQEGLEYIEKANKYFAAKDYFAAGNYLRKEAERLLKSLLPNEYRLKVSEPWGSEELTEFEGLKNKLKKYYEDCEIVFPISVKIAIDTYQRAVLNPTSHDDNSSPIYRKEIETAFNMVNELSGLEQIKREIIIPIGTQFIYTNVTKNYSVNIVLASSNIFKITQGGAQIFTNPKYRIHKWEWQGVPFSNMKAANVSVPAAVIEKHTTELYDSNRLVSLIANSLTIPENTVGNFNDIFLIRAGVSLSNLLV